MTSAPRPPIGPVVAAWAQEIVAHENITTTELARRANISQPTMSRLVNGETPNPSLETLRALADISPIAVPAAIKSLLDRRTDTRQEREVNASPAIDGIPIWGVHPLHRDGVLKMNQMPLSFLRRPSTLPPLRRLAAFYAPDETMAPRWQMGEPVIIDLLRPGNFGQYCLLEFSPENPNDTEEFYFRRYDRRSDGMCWLSTACGEPGELKIPVARLLGVKRILDWSDLLGGA